jgi:hypothetical protein
MRCRDRIAAARLATSPTGWKVPQARALWKARAKISTKTSIQLLNEERQFEKGVAESIQREPYIINKI